MNSKTEFDELINYYINSEKDYSFSDTLSPEDVYNIKSLVKQKRCQYANAPIGTEIFDFIKESEKAIDFQLISLDKNTDAILYITNNSYNTAWIIINSKLPLVNQIFAAAHEYYHYIKDYEDVKKEPFICQFKSLQNIIEQKANRFAAELLLPTEALINEVNQFQLKLKDQNSIKEDDFISWASLSIYLTIKYEMPLKAVLFRLFEEKYISKINNFLSEYKFLKQFIIECKILKNKTEKLFSSYNPLQDETATFSRMIIAYRKGFITREQLLEDAKTIGLDILNVEKILEDVDSQIISKHDDINVIDDNIDDDDSLIEFGDIISRKLEG